MGNIKSEISQQQYIVVFKLSDSSSFILIRRKNRINLILLAKRL
jgi:hypothetical protein